jgi:hypothetical protein
MRTGHLYRLTVEFTHKEGLTGEDREQIARKVKQQIGHHAWPGDVSIDYVDFTRDRESR